MNLARVFAVIVAAAIGSTAYARAPVRVNAIRDQAIVTSRGGAPSLGDVRSAITRAAAVRGWALSEPAQNSFLATLTVRGRHVVAVRVTFDTRAFSFAYVSSTNMDYVVRGGVPLIHPKYNQWTSTFANDIRAELARL